MKKSKPKVVGIVSLQENDNISTAKPWEPVTKANLPYSVLSQPNGFMFAHGSACGSLPSISREGWRYVADVHFFRKDKNGVDVDRYIGSITPSRTLAILKIPSGKISEHHLRQSDPIISNLPSDEQKQVLSILGKQKS